jgi:PKD repeat protein
VDSSSRQLVAIMLTLFLVCSFLLVIPVSSSYASNIYPTHDSWIEAEYPAGNHGSDTDLRVKSDSRTRRSYLKFDLSSIPNGKTATSVKLYLYCISSDANPNVQVYVHGTGDNWDESSITWNNAPAVGSLITSISVGGTGRYYCWDITPYGQAEYSGDKVLSVVVKLLLDDPTQKDNPNLARYFASKEYTGTARDPYLEVTYENTSPTASFTYSPTYPVANDTVTFNASESYDPDGYITTYSWDFGDGNITTVTIPTIEHVFATYANYTVTLTVTDNDGLTNSETQIVEVVDPAILRVSLPEGIYVKQHTGDPWIDEGWLLNKTGNSWSFNVKIYDTSNRIQSDDTHLIVALNNVSYANLQSLTINGTSIPKTAFKYGTPKPYGTKYWPDCVYPTWFNDTYINVGTILPKGYTVLAVSVTFSAATNAKMHFDAYGHECAPFSWSQVTWSPNSEDSTVQYQIAPQPLTVSISPASAIIDLGQQVSFSSTVSGGTPPPSYQWYLNGSAVSGATSSSWIFTPASVGYYQVYANVTDSSSTRVKSNVAGVTVNPALSVSIQPGSSVIILGQSVNFSSTVSGGTTPYSYKWYLDDTEVSGATSPSWAFTPPSTGYYLVSLKVTDAAPAAKLSNEADITANPRTYTLTIMTTAGGTTNPALGTYTYIEGTNVQVNATPNVNYKFVYWELDGSYNGTNNSTTVLMNANHTLKAVFAMVTYTLTITATTGGTTSPAPGTYTFDSGSSVNVTALPSANYFFDHWVLDGSPAGTANPISVLMSNNRTLQAVFSLINYTLTITTTAGGTTNPAPGTYTYASGSSVNVTATPYNNYKFVRWVLDGSNVTDNPITVQMNGNHTLNAVFMLLTYRLTIVSSTGGTTDLGPGVHIYTNGTSASVTAIPDTYYVLDYWLLDGNKAGSSNPFTILMMDDHTLQPIFAHVNYTLTISATTGGTTNPIPGTYTYSGGTTVAVNAISGSGYRFDHWVFDSVAGSWPNPAGILMNGSHTLQAVFVETHTLTISVSQGGTTNPAPGTYTYDNPTNVSVQAIPSANYFFDHWAYDGVDKGSQNPIIVYVGSSHSLYPVFSLINYTLTIQTTTGGNTSPSPGTYVYSNGTTVGVTANPSANYTLDHWELDGSNVGSANPYTVTMNQNRTLKAFFKPSSAPPPLSVTISPSEATIYTTQTVTLTRTISGGTSPYSYQWYLNGNPVPGATSVNWTFTPLGGGTYYIYLRVTDANGTTVQSGTSVITVIQPSTGGYSISLAKQTPTSYLVAYGALIALFGATLSLKKRKRK